MTVRRLLLALILAAPVCILSGWYSYPKKQTLSINPAYTGYYRGLGLHDGEGLTGKNWYAIVVREDQDGFWRVEFDHFGYNPYKGYYGDGALREEGTILVERNGGDVAAFRHDVEHGKYYSPDGKLISQVIDGTGKQLLCCQNGQPFWELDLVDGKYAHVKMWTCAGQLIHEGAYRNGKPHGESVGYYPDGQLRNSGNYTDGERTGVWKHYAPDGEIESEQDYGGEPAADAVPEEVIQAAD